mgnify:CR=1 FL=1
MIRIGLILCVMTSLIASATACSSKGSPSSATNSPAKVAALKLCRAEYQLQSKLKAHRSNPSGKTLALVGKARGEMFVARRNLALLAGESEVPASKLKWCGDVSRSYLATSNQRVTRATRSLCREVRAQDFAKRHDLIVTDSLVEPLKSEYRWHAEWYNEDSMRASSHKNLPKEARSLKQVLSSC